MGNYTNQSLLSSQKCLYCKNLKINKKIIEFINKEEKLKALEVIDDFMSEEDEEFDKKDSKL